MLRYRRTLFAMAASALLLAACGGADTTDNDAEAAVAAEEDDVEAAEGSEAADEVEGASDDEGDAASGFEHSYEDDDTITIIVPTSPGGGFDTQARILQPFFEASLRELSGVDINLQVETMPGGGHLTGMQFAAQAPADGLTLLYAGSSIGAGHQVFDDADLDMTAYTAIGTVGLNDLGFAIRQDLELPGDDLLALIERSQEEPILMGHTGTQPQLEMMVGILADEDGIEFAIDYVTLEGTSGVMTALLRDEIEVGVISPAGAAPIIADNPDDLELFLSLGCDPSPADPDALYMGTQDVPSADVICSTLGGEWRAIFAPGGLPDSETALLAAALEDAHTDTDFQEQLADTGFESGHLGPDDLRSYLVQLIDVWSGYAQYTS